MMFRTAALFLLAAPVAQGFSVVAPTASRSMMAQPMVLNAAPEEGKEDFTAEDSEMFGFNDSVDMEYEDLYDHEDEQVQVPVTTTSSMKDDDKLNQAKDALKAAKSKVEDFANDERVQEIAGKAQDFAKDVVGQLFGKVGDKLKELKKAKEERAKQEEL